MADYRLPAVLRDSLLGLLVALIMGAINPDTLPYALTLIALVLVGDLIKTDRGRAVCVRFRERMGKMALLIIFFGGGLLSVVFFLGATKLIPPKPATAAEIAAETARLLKQPDSPPTPEPKRPQAPSAPPYKLDLHEDMSIVRYAEQGQDARFAALFFNLAITNSSTESRTLRNVHLQYSFQGNQFEEDSIVLVTKDIYSPQLKKNVDAVHLYSPTDRIVVMDWHNLRTELEDRLLMPGAVIHGSAVFALAAQILQPPDLRKVANMRLVITDFQGKESRHPIAITERVISGANQLVLRNP